MTQGVPVSDSSPRRRRAALFRQVSQEGLSNSLNEEPPSLKCTKSTGRGSPARCVSDFDKIAGASHAVHDSNEGDCSSLSAPAFRTPLDHPSIFEHHATALRLEAELHPFRLILSRLMYHPTLNRKGIFNTPVDPVALNLPDYSSVVKRPMDLGTVKADLHSVAYQSREAVVEDIRLVFANAMMYNPPTNLVHLSAMQLLAFFEEQLEAFVPGMPEDALPAQATFRTSPLPSQHQYASAEQTEASRKLSIGCAAAASTWKTVSAEFLAPATILNSKKRMKRGSKKSVAHSCQWCEGQKCAICTQGCLHLEPTLLICNGPQCFGAKVRKGATYYIAPDGSRQYCERCHIGLPAVLQNGASDDVCRYKRDLLKRKNDEELVEAWLSCSKCNSRVHKVCAMFNECAQSETDFVCPGCVSSEEKMSPHLNKKRVAFAGENSYTYISGSSDPIPLDDFTNGCVPQDTWTSDMLPESSVSGFIQEKVREVLRSDDYPNADKTVTVRIISECDRHYKVPEVVRNHFRVATGRAQDDTDLRPPSHVHYQSKAIALFQKIDGVDVCIFCMYVQEYDGEDVYDQSTPLHSSADQKRVYIAYLDSVEHFRPRRLRTSVYHEILVSYLATARMRGFSSAHIWACPPTRGNSFVFWTYPGSQRTPTKDRLTTWYHEALSRALDRGIVTDVKSLYESNFESLCCGEADEDSSRFACPPLLDGDFWIEEALRLHAMNMSRYLKSRTADGRIILSPADRPDSEDLRCPSLKVAGLLREKIIENPISLFFRKPVNAAVLNLKDYHEVVSRPMDLGTIYARCMLGEYAVLEDLVDEVELVVSNAKTYNPPGHVVHVKADELRDLFYTELNELVKSWPVNDRVASEWTEVRGTSLRLGESFPLEKANSEIAPDSIPHANTIQSCDWEIKSDVVAADLLRGGAPAVEQRMVGSDTWLLEKKPPPVAAKGKGAGPSKKAQSRRRKSVGPGEREPPAKRRRQTWLAEEVGSSVRRMRSFFFSCTLAPRTTPTPDEQGKIDEFSRYTRHFDIDMKDLASSPSKLADARHALLEFSQFRNLQFDTLRRAKYSTAVLLYHLHNAKAPGVIPCCAGCGQQTREVRWHKVGKVNTSRRKPLLATAPRRSEPAAFVSEELCPSCFASRADQSHFIPVQVSCSPH